jgi:6-phospho-3-hexuloisomerase
MTAARDASAFILDAITKLLSEDRTEDLNACVELLLKAPQVFVYGVGRSGLVARAFAMRLVQLGLACFFIGETITPIVESGDCVLIVSNTGSTMSAVQTANIARRVGASVVSVTGSRTSKLAHASNVVVQIGEGNRAETSKNAPLATLFEDATLVLLDGVVAQVMEKLGETESTMRARHAIMV